MLHNQFKALLAGREQTNLPHAEI